MHKLGLKKWGYRNVPLGELNDGQVAQVIDYLREPFARADCDEDSAIKEPLRQKTDRALVRSQLATKPLRCIASDFE